MERLRWMFWTLLSGCVIVASSAVPEAAQKEAESASAIVLEEILVKPANPGPDTLCKLSVRIRNDGSETASQFGFAITINGQGLTVYSNQLFMYPVEAGESLEFPLYNFWTTETSRPTLKDGKLQLEVAIVEAQWMNIELEEEVEVWTPLGAVEGLPSTAQITLSAAEGGTS